MAAPGRRDQQAASDSDWKYLKILECDDAPTRSAERYFQKCELAHIAFTTPGSILSEQG
jgi:hypothetical protein